MIQRQNPLEVAMAITDSSDLEILEYLRFLAEHGRYCGQHECSLCKTARKVCDAMKSVLFDSGTYRRNESARTQVNSPVALP